MKFKDPATVTCPRCSATSTQQVAALLALEARCPECGGDLSERGLKMRRGLDDWSTYVIAIELTCVLEKALGCTVTDEGLERVKTLRDVVALIDPAKDSAAYKAVADAVQQVRRDGMFKHVYTGPDCDAVVNFDANLADVFMPTRWDQR
jgi:hypothetical protein